MAEILEFLVNPNAGGGKCKEVWRNSIEPDLKTHSLDYKVHFSKAPGEISQISRDLSLKGSRWLVAVGGDGTHNEFVTGLAQVTPSSKRPAVAFLTLGTGGDFRRTLGLPREPARQLHQIISDFRVEKTKALDLGSCRFVGENGQEMTRAFVNIASFGISAEVARNVNQSSKALGGFLTFLTATLKAAPIYKARKVSLELDGKPLGEFKVLTVAVANGSYFGGGMKIAPQANPSDGLLDIILLGDLNSVETLIWTPSIYKGDHLKMKKVKNFRGKQLKVHSLEKLYLELDGETPGQLPATFTIEAAALRVFGFLN